jgi:uncharacterized protein (TIGR03435 family)
MYRALFLTVITSAGLWGQSFDVASIHPHDPDNKTFVARMPSRGAFSGEGVPLQLLVMLAYGVQESQIVDAPGWVSSEKWDIDAKSENRQYSDEETNLMLQHLLEERFSLKLHRETRQQSAYVLTVAKGGPNFRTSDKLSTNVHSGARGFSIENGGLPALTGLLATALGRPVVDKTGLTGNYDISIVWDDAPVRDAGLPGAQGPDAQQSTVPDEHGSIFTAVREQLGLRLNGSRVAVEVLVVDAAKRPSPN